LQHLARKIGQMGALAKKAGYGSLVSYLVGSDKEEAGAQTGRITALQLGLLGKAGTGINLMARQTAAFAVAGGMSEQMRSALGGMPGFTRNLATSTMAFTTNFQQSLAACASVGYDEEQDIWVTGWEDDYSKVEVGIEKLLEIARRGGMQAILQEASTKIRTSKGGPRVISNAVARLAMDAPVIVSDLAAHPRFSELIDAVMEGMQASGTTKGLSKSAIAMMIFKDPAAARAQVEASRKRPGAAGVGGVSARRKAIRQSRLLGAVGEQFMEQAEWDVTEEGRDSFTATLQRLGISLFRGSGEDVDKDIRARRLEAWQKKFGGRGERGVEEWGTLMQIRASEMEKEAYRKLREEGMGPEEARDMAKRTARVGMETGLGSELFRMYEDIQAGNRVYGFKGALERRQIAETQVRQFPDKPERTGPLRPGQHSAEGWMVTRELRDSLEKLNKTMGGEVGNVKLIENLNKFLSAYIDLARAQEGGNAEKKNPMLPGPVKASGPKGQKEKPSK
jgi:hypothetical protein